VRGGSTRCTNTHNVPQRVVLSPIRSNKLFLKTNKARRQRTCPKSRPEKKRDVMRCTSSSSSGDEFSSEGPVSLSDTAEMEIAGFSISPHGFLVLLSPLGATVPKGLSRVEELRGLTPDVETCADEKALAVLVTDGTDTSTAESTEALTLLQLAQYPPIDMGTCLPYEALYNVTGKDDAVLGAVIIVAAGSGPGSSFKATLLAGNTETSGSWDVYPQGQSIAKTAWETMGLLLRYSPYGAKLFVTRELLQLRGLPLSDLVATYPLMISRETVLQQGASVMQNLNNALREASDNQ